MIEGIYMNIKLKRSIPLIIIVLTILIFRHCDWLSNQFVSTEQNKTYSSESFSLDYPSNWTISSKNDSGLVVINPRSQSIYRDNITVQIQEGSFGKVHNVKSVVEMYEKGLSVQDDPYMSNGKLVYYEDTTFQNYEAGLMITKHTVRKANHDVISHNLLVPVGNKLFMLSYSTDYEQTDKSDFFNELINGFVIK